jgi:hypothetical protein
MSMHDKPWHQMEINGQFHTPATVETPLRKYWIWGSMCFRVDYDTVAKTIPYFLEYRINHAPHFSRSRKKLIQFIKAIKYTCYVLPRIICIFNFNAMFFTNFSHYYTLCFCSHVSCNIDLWLELLTCITIHFVHQGGQNTCSCVSNTRSFSTDKCITLASLGYAKTVGKSS